MKKLTPEMERERQEYLVSMYGLKGRKLHENVKIYIGKYNEIPEIPVLRKPISEFE